MIKVSCFRCHQELDKLGGLLFSPPLGFNQVKKFHVCIHCYDDIVYFPITKNKKGDQMFNWKIQKVKWYGIKDECCTNDNIKESNNTVIDGQCKVCKRCFTR